MTTRRRCVFAIAVLAAAVRLKPDTTAQAAVPPQIVVTNSAAQFEVASIRPSPQNNVVRGPIEGSLEMTIARGTLGAAARNGRFRTTGMHLRLLIQLAYDVRHFQVIGGPSWVGSDRYAIEATTAGQATPDQLRAMLQSLLADRFKLTLRRETRRMPVYELAAASEGLKIVPMKEGDCITLKSPMPMDLAKPVYVCGGMRRKVTTMPPDRTDRIEAGGIGMHELVEIISEDLGRIVVDKTGFGAPFNLLLDFAPLRDREPGPSSSAPTISTAVREQLGLQLRSTTGPVDVLVIDDVSRPSPN